MRLFLILFMLVCGNAVAGTCQTLPFVPDPAKQLRVMISTDASNEADDAFAVVHALLTPTFDVRGLIAAQYNRTAKMMKNPKPTMAESHALLTHLAGIMGHETPVYRGAVNALSDKPQPVSAGAQAIIHEALREDSRPLFILVLGPATDIAQALEAQPEIASRLTVVWIGGNPYPAGGWEYNMFNDPRAASLLFASNAPLWQVPHNVYMSMRVSLAELAVQVKPQGETGAWLWQQLIEFNQWASAQLKGVPWPKSEVWIMGDNPAVGLLLDDHEYAYEERPAPALNDDLSYKTVQGTRTIRVYQRIDSRFILEDFFAKLRLACGE